MAKKIFSQSDKYGEWSLINRIPGGGNGSIWITKDSDGEERIIKLLRKTHDTARTRFLDEIRIMKTNSNINGVMTIIDHCDLENIPDTLWYVMPKGTLLQEVLNDKEPLQIVSAIIEIAKTLEELHIKEVSHRDIKPQNLLFVDDVYTIADFGLVDYPLKEEGLTLEGSPLGPRWTIAPEMRNNPEDSDGIKADVYSLSKTLWILLTGIRKGFEGQYSPTGSIGLIHFQPTMYLNVIEDLFVLSTENNPELRPDIKDFISQLNYWIDCQNDFLTKNKLDWKLIQQKLFPTSVPNRVIWEDIDSIISILNIIGGIQALNHVMFPVSGGMDLEGAITASESGCIELDFGSIYIIKPKRLIFEAFNSDYEWNYFRLETENLEAVLDNFDPIYEYLTEVSPAQYESCEYYDNYYEDHGKPPMGTRNLTRVLSGSFVVFQKTSSYNSTPATYDGRHNKTDADGFREYIKSLIKQGYKVERFQDENGNFIGKRFLNSPIPQI